MISHEAVILFPANPFLMSFYELSSPGMSAFVRVRHYPARPVHRRLGGGKSSATAQVLQGGAELEESKET